MAAIRALSLTDIRNVTRDSLLQFMIGYPLIMGPMMRVLIPWAAEGLAELHDITQYYPLLTALFGVAMVPALLGTAIGLLLLDERDARTLVALQVTPLTMTGYLLYRLLMPMGVSVVAGYFTLWVMGLTPIPWAGVLPLVLLGAVGGPLYALVLAGFANNKVQGLAMIKAMGIFIIGPTAAWFIAEPWQWLLGLLPTFWPIKGLWVLLDGGNIVPIVLGGVVVNAVYGAALLVRFRRVMARLSA